MDLHVLNQPYKFILRTPDAAIDLVRSIVGRPVQAFDLRLLIRSNNGVSDGI